MKKTYLALGCTTFILSMCSIFVQIYASWLLYNHVHATEVMWFLFWLSVPIQVTISIVVQLTKTFAESVKEKEKE